MIIHSGRSKIDNFVASLVYHNRLWSAVLQFQEGGREDEGGARGLPKHTMKCNLMKCNLTLSMYVRGLNSKYRFNYGDYYSVVL